MQILGGSVGDFLATQIVAPHPAHCCWRDATFGVGLSDTR